MLSFEENKTSQPSDEKATKQDKAAGQSAAAQYFTLICSLVAVVLLLFAIIAGSGGAASAEARPKAVVFIVEGLQGTVFEEIGVNGFRAPNMRKVIASGAHAACFGPSDTRCCRTQAGRRLGAPYTWQSAPGLASILTGVDAAKHQVFNSSFDAMIRFSSTSQQAPTFLKVAVGSGLKTAAVGSNSLLTTIGVGAACSAYGILDFECGPEAINRCMRSTSCNLIERLPLLNSGASNKDAIKEIVTDVERALTEGADLTVVHLTRVNAAAVNAPGGAFSATSAPYAAQLYLADAVFGQVMAMIERRSAQLHENWLVLGTSDHGGHGRTFGTEFNVDELVPLFAHVHTPAGHMPLRAPVPPVRQMDVAPTVLEWFGLLDSSTAANLDGRVQFICGTGAAGGNCTSASD